MHLVCKDATCGGLILSQISPKNSFPITQARRNSRGSFLLAYLYRYTPITNKKTGLWLGVAEGAGQNNEITHTSFSGWALLAQGAFFMGLAKINKIGKNTESEEMRSSEQWKQGNTCSWSPRTRLRRVFLCLHSVWRSFFAPSFSFYSLFTFLHGSRSYRFWFQEANQCWKIQCNGRKDSLITRNCSALLKEL